MPQQAPGPPKVVPGERLADLNQDGPFGVGEAFVVQLPVTGLVLFLAEGNFALLFHAAEQHSQGVGESVRHQDLQPFVPIWMTTRRFLAAAASS
jgi:hypothetical protein